MPHLSRSVLQELLYPDHDTKFAVSINGSAAFERPLKDFKVVREGDSIVEPLITFWSWDKMQLFTQAKAVQFSIAGEAFSVPEEAVAALRDMVRYFGNHGV